MKYSSLDLFGKELDLSYDPAHAAEFQVHILSLFVKKNPNWREDFGLRKAFTKLLHEHNLCWPGCTRHHGIMPPLEDFEKLNKGDSTEG